MNAQAVESNQQKIGLLIFAIAISIFTLAFNATTFYNLTPLLIKEFNLATTTAQWLFNSYLLAILALVVVGGKLADNFGRRTIFLIGSLVFALGSFVIAIGINGWMFILGRTIQGLGVAFVFPGSSSLIRDSVPEDKQIFVFGIWSAASGLGMALGPVIGGIIAEILNWRVVFIVNIGVMVFACIIILLCASNNKNRSVNQMDFIGLILFIISITAIVLALVEGNIWGWIDIKTLSSLTVGIISLVIFLYVETKIPYPLLDLKSFTNPFFSLSLIGLCMYAFAMNALLFFLNLLIQNPLLENYNTQQAGLAILPLCLAYFFSSLLSNWLLKWFKYEGIVICLIFILSTLSFFIFAHTTVMTHYSYFILPLILAGLSFGISQTLFPKIAIAALPKEKTGEASGMVVKSIYLGVILAISLGGIIYHQSTEHHFSRILESYKVNHQLQTQLYQQWETASSSFFPSIQHMREPLHSALITATKHAAVAGFNAIAWLITIFALLNLVAVILIYKYRN
ncbi:MFS transporter [Legionella gresilensis]|uniref:MFS transporter n=1 Tax=Legionella gresilensis TaxID=91823 RepID=UPI0010413B27|nr:MFS transporter [Legionella gresilensis]